MINSGNSTLTVFDRDAKPDIGRQNLRSEICRQPAGTLGEDLIGVLRGPSHYIENLINEINRILYGGGDISDKDLKLMEQMIAELNDRINKY